MRFSAFLRPFLLSFTGPYFSCSIQPCSFKDWRRWVTVDLESSRLFTNAEVFTFSVSSESR